MRRIDSIKIGDSVVKDGQVYTVEQMVDNIVILEGGIEIDLSKESLGKVVY